MIELDDCGRTLLLGMNGPEKQEDVKVIMVIKAPGGTMALFDQGYIDPDTQCEAIGAFMKEHKED